MYKSVTLGKVLFAAILMLCQQSKIFGTAIQRRTYFQVSRPVHCLCPTFLAGSISRHGQPAGLYQEISNFPVAGDRPADPLSAGTTDHQFDGVL